MIQSTNDALDQAASKTFLTVIAERYAGVDPVGDDPIDEVADVTEEPCNATSKSAFAEPSASELSETERMLSMFAASSVAQAVDAAIKPAVIAKPSITKQTKVPLWKTSSGDAFRRVYKKTGYAWRDLPCIEIKNCKLAGLYLVHPKAVLPPPVKERVKMFNFYTAVNHSGEFGVWYIGQAHAASFNSAIDAMRECCVGWRGIIWKTDHYDTVVPTAAIPEPDWDRLPDGTSIFVLATRDRTITDDRHPVVRYLLGYPEIDVKTATDADGF